MYFQKLLKSRVLIPTNEAKLTVTYITLRYFDSWTGGPLTHNAPTISAILLISSHINLTK